MKNKKFEEQFLRALTEKVMRDEAAETAQREALSAESFQETADSNASALHVLDRRMQRRFRCSRVLAALGKAGKAVAMFAAVLLISGIPDYTGKESFSPAEPAEEILSGESSDNRNNLIGTSIEEDNQQNGVFPPEVLVFQEKGELQDFLALGNLANQELESVYSTWNGLYFMDRDRYQILSSFIQGMLVPKQAMICINSFTVHLDEELSADWGVSFMGGNAIIKFISTKEEPMKALAKTAEKNKITLHPMENSNMKCLYFCEQNVNEMLTMYYGVVDSYFICVSFAKTEKTICDQIVTSLHFVSFASEVE